MKILVSALEPSANLHLKEILKNFEDEFELMGIFSEELGTPYMKSSEFSAMGFVEVLPLIFKAKKAMKVMSQMAKEIVKFIVSKVLNDEISLNQREFLNVNIPARASKNFKGYAVVPAGRRTYATHATLNRNPRGIEYYWLGNAALEYEKGEPSDISKVNEGFATITPIKLNMTSYESLENLKGEFDAK